MSKRLHMISVRFTDEEFDALNNEFQKQLRGVINGLSFSLSDMVRIKTLRTDPAQGKQSETLYDKRRTA